MPKPKRVPAPSGWSNWGEYIKAKASVVEDRFKYRNEIIQSCHEHRMMQVQPVIPEKFKKTASEVRSSIVWNFCTRSAAILGDSLPVPHVIPPAARDLPSEKSKEFSSELELWLKACYEKLNEEEFFAMVVDSVPEKGLGVFKVIPRHKDVESLRKSDKEEDKEFKKRQKEYLIRNFPFKAEYVSPDTFYPISGRSGELELMEIYEQSFVDVMDKWAITLGMDKKVIAGKARGLNYDDVKDVKVKFIEYWKAATMTPNGEIEPGVFVYMVDDVVVEQGKHNWTRLPYFVVEGNITSSLEPGERNIPLSFPLCHNQDNLDMDLTIWRNWAVLSAFPPLRLTPVPGDEMALPYDEDEPITWAPGEIIDAPGNIVEWMPAPNIGSDLVAMIAQERDMASQSSLDPILGGRADTKDTSGTTLMTMLAIGRSIFGTSDRSISKAFTNMAHFILEVIDRDFEIPVPVFSVQHGKYLEIGPNDIDGYYEVRHEKRTVIPAEAQVKSVHLADAQARGLVSKRFAREEGYSIESPEKMADEVDLEKFEDSNTWKAMMAQKFLEYMGLESGTPGAEGSQPAMPIGPGGFGQPQSQGIQQPLQGGAMAGRVAPQVGANPNPAAGGGI